MRRISLKELSARIFNRKITANSIYSKDEDEKLYPSPAGTPLTENETTFIKSIFGDSIKADVIRKHFSIKEKPGTDKGYVIPAQTFGLDCLKFYGPQYAEDDYSKTDDIFNYGTFIHEITHIWQNQQRHQRPPGDTPEGDNRTYAYELTPQTDFRKLGEEQQAKMIEDYARQFLFLKRLPAAKTDTYRPSHAQGNAKASLYKLVHLQKAIEDVFPQARKTRLALESQQAKKASPHMRKPRL